MTGADNNVTIGTGIAWINNEEFSGKVAALKSAEVLDLGIADGTYPRIDVIAIQYSANNNATDVVIKKGTPATNPVRPSIVRTGAIYELYLASVYRPAGATAVTASNITDLRMDGTVCGLMADSVTKVDMDAIRAQLTGLVEELEEAIQNIEVGEVVPIEKGGTNARTSEEARQNLGVTLVGLTTFQGVDINIGALSANGYKNVTVDAPVIEGYSPIGITYYLANQVHVYPIAFGINSSGQIQGYVKNTSSSALSSLYVYLKIVYIKNDF